MTPRDRRASFILIAAAAVAWVLVGWIFVNLDPRVRPASELAGAVAIGAAGGLTSIPLFWLASFARQRRIAYRGDWVRALRRGLWVASLAGGLVLLRLEGLFQPQVALFLVALAAIAEITLSARR
ncbi:MAG TPA: hypothetical protein VEX41_11420 [Candidatus Eisenbacteria bacterium]|nr:hypothetical protein [Candidatus Eisenbacteria bacterium]